MATLLLTAAASALTAGASAFAQIAAAAAAAAVGGFLDNRLLGAPGAGTQQGPRLDNLQVQASTEGAAIPEIAGRARLAGQIIWATKFKEVATAAQGSGGKGGGGSTAGAAYVYYTSFAVGLCEGEIDRVGRVWADGKPLAMNGVAMRVHRGGPGQPPDPLIEGVEGAARAPAYRGLAYVVFENLEITRFGNRIPQLTFEVFRRVSPSDGSGLEDLVTAVALIPGAGERVYDPVAHMRDLGGGAARPENRHAGQDVADWSVALDDLQASLPNARTILFVVGWFGDDLRAGLCTVRPKVEVASKSTTPNAWRVHGLTRDRALVVSAIDGRPAYGGTPSDDSVVRAIRDLKARGLSVVFYPFLFIDIPAGNSLPDPWTGNIGQPAWPWRGRVTCDPAPGRPGTVDQTPEAARQVAAFFGAATRDQVWVSVNALTNAVAAAYAGPPEWSYRRFILHCARLCAAINAIDPGAVDGFLIGSELRALTAIRDGPGHFPAVDHLRALAADARAILGTGVKIGYAADWSDYGRWRPGDGSLFFHLDPLWADPNIDFVGIDFYAPLSDWRDGDAHLDAAKAASIYDRGYLQSNVEGGEHYDWFYASQADRDAQNRTPITDGAYSKPWVWRAKDVRNWWLNQHYDRPGGVESAAPTAWIPQSKPIWFTEFGVPSVDRGTNQPNVFYDPKSSESALPHHSRGWRDDLIQRRGVEAVLTYWAANNPTSPVYGGSMIEKIALWTWDARPYPAWPARADAWSDGGLWPLGHWLNGKIGLADLGALTAERCARVGFRGCDVAALVGVVTGYVRDRPMSPRAEIEALMQAFAFDAAESEGVIRFLPRGRSAVATFEPDDCAPGEDGELVKLTRAQETDLPETVAVAFIDAGRGYQSGAAAASRTAGHSARRTDVGLPLVMDASQAQAVADRLLAESWIGRETAQLVLPPDAVRLDAGDVVNIVVNGAPREFRLTRITDAWSRRAEAQRCEGAVYAPPLPGLAPPAFEPPPAYGGALLEFLDLPMLRDSDVPWAPYAAASASPFAGVTVMDSATSVDYALDATLPLCARMGETVFDFWPGPTERFDNVNTLRVKLYSGELASLDDAAILSGRANALAILNADGDWEIVQFAAATLVASGVYDLTRLLRGRLGTEHAMRAPTAAGARVVVLDGALAQVDAALAERGQTRFYRWGPTPLPPSDTSWRQGTFIARCVGLKPWAPAHLAGRRNAAGDLAITWVRRARVGGAWLDGTDVPLNEESERYELDVLNNGQVVRTIAATEPAALYAAAQQTADFGSAQPAIAVRIFQLSTSVGRGWPATATL